MSEVSTLGKVLDSATEFRWNEALYLPVSRNWSLESPAIVWDPDDVADDEEEVPEFPRQHRMMYVLGVSIVQDIVLNARQQKPNCSIDDLYQAFMHYLSRDAFIQFGGE